MNDTPRLKGVLAKKFSLTISYTVSQIITFLYFIIFVAYIAWEAYWYKKVGLAFIKWHTHLALVIFTFSILLLVLQTLKQWASIIKVNFDKLRLLIMSTFVGVFLLELIFVLTPWMKSYSEINNGHYLSAFTVDEDNTYHIWEKSGTHIIERSEYSISRSTNSLGYSDKEWIISDTSKIRILCNGDSFTEGDGAPQDSSYPTLLQKNLDIRLPHRFEVLNAGTCGSDPFYGFKAYADILLKFKPKIIVQTICSHDIYGDYSTRGGLERFKQDGKVQYKQGNSLEFIYAISYTSRLVLNLISFDFGDGNLSYNKEKMQADFYSLFEKYDSLARSQNSQLLIVLLPMKNEVKKSHYDLNYSFLKKFNLIDLLSLYNTLGINDSTYKDYYWIEDAHHNPKGYAKMAQAIELALAQKGVFNHLDSLTANHTYQISNTDSQIPTP